ncbi:uncharacterized protein [Halyomorpha halys]|uniref:uncharacterized protein n=1 Tax=Halyomorpha halys TaxID=286706 RepID=UPI0034D3042C
MSCHIISGHIIVANPTPVHNKWGIFQRDQQPPQQQRSHQQPKARRPPPIIISPAMAQQSVKEMLAIIRITKFSINNSSQETRLYLDTEDDHKQVSELMKKTGLIQFHTFAPRGTKRSKKWVLFGFDLDTDLQGIASDLQENLPGFKLIRRLTKTQPSGLRAETELLQLVTEHYVKISDIRKLGAIDHVRFQVSPFREDGCPVQCRQCQQYGHTIRYCTRTVKCPRCSENHEFSQCTLTGPPKCTLCNKEGHMATAKECPVRVNLLEKRRTTREAPALPPAQPRRQQPSRVVQKDITFSELMGGSPAQRTQQPQTQPAPVSNASMPAMDQLCARMDQMMSMVTMLMEVMGKILARHYD